MSFLRVLSTCTGFYERQHAAACVSNWTDFLGRMICDWDIKAEVWLIRVYNKKVRNDIVKKLRYFKNLEQSRDNWETD